MKNLKYNKISKEIISKIIDIVGKEFVFLDIEDIYPYSMDGTLFTGKTIPDLVVQPHNTQEVSEILKIANENMIPVTPRGSGTSLAGNPLPIYGGIVLDLTLMNKIEKIDIPNNFVIVEPGVICDVLNHELEPFGYFFPPDPGSSSAATIGGMVANNSGGLQAFKYGVTKNYVIWMEVVLASGEIIEFGSKTLKSVSDFNMSGLMVGSEGTLGVITKIGLKIIPKPQHRKTGFYIYDEFEKITEIIILIRQRGIVPNMQEFLDKTTTKVCFQYLGGEYINYPLGYFLLLEVDGTKEQTEKDFSIIHSICLQNHPIFYKIAQNPSNRADIIQARKVALPALSQLSPTTSLEDCTINITNLAEALHEIEKIGEKYKNTGLQIATFGHLEGNLHPTFMFDENNTEHVKNFYKSVEEIYENVVLPLGGTVTGEHGVGLVKSEFFKKEHGKSVKLMHEIKKVFDPNLILNPGKAKGMEIAKENQANAINVLNPLNNLQTTSYTLSCMRCGFCVVECPSYMHFRKESYSPRGKFSILRGLLRGDLKLSKKIQNILYSCMLCGLCIVRCPALINTIDIFENTRQAILKKEKNP
ncbi:MAG: FAD-linked oxidase C-terminal domain-containing protein [Promethearchaeota archaeon]